MRLQKSIRNNLKFLLVEVSAQLKNLKAFFEHQDTRQAQRIVERSSYTYNLKLRIQNACMLQLQQNSEYDPIRLRAVAAIALDLDRIVELCRDCLHQLGFLRNEHQLDLAVYLPLVNKVNKSVQLIEEALLNNDSELALKLGRAEHKLDKSYNKILDAYTEELKQTKHTQDYVSGLFVARSIEQMGDVLRNISEAIISSNIGQDIDTPRYQSLQKTLNDWVDQENAEALAIKTLAETKSGSGIASVHYTDDQDQAHLAVFKDGQRKKLKEEVNGVEQWHEVYPGLAPRILTYKKKGDNAALLIEHLEGMTCEQLLLEAPVNLFDKSMKALKNTLQAVWTETKSERIVCPAFMQQLRKRLPDVYSIHPQFKHSAQKIGAHQIADIDQLIDTAEEIEKQAPPSFSVFIHGDFNLDNIIYDNESDKINFIDLHRSTYMDYVQDISVFMVSNYRLQVFDKPIRKRIAKQAEHMYHCGQAFAQTHTDKTFELRLSLGLARSFLSSTRFIMDKTLAKRMFMRGRYLLEHICALSPKQRKQYQLPFRDIFYA